MYLAWLHGGHDPFRLFHGLDDAYRKLGNPDSEPWYPARPWSVRNVIYGFAIVAEREQLARAELGAAAGGVGG